MARTRFRGDNLGPMRDGDVMKVRLTQMDGASPGVDQYLRDELVADEQRTLIHDGFGGRPARRPSFVFDRNPYAPDELAIAYAEYEQSLCDAWRSPESRLAEAKESAAESDPRNGRSNPAGSKYKAYRLEQSALPFAEKAGWQTYEELDEDDDDRVSADARTLADLRRVHLQKTTDAYSAYDAEIRQAYRKTE